MVTLTLLLKKQELGNAAKRMAHSAWRHQAGQQVPVRCRTAGQGALGIGLRRGGDILFNARYCLFRIRFSPVGKEEKF